LQYHPKENVDKMSKGIPLTDEDRWGWLEVLRKAAMEKISPDKKSESNGSMGTPQGVIVTCSALRHRYRDVLRVAVYNHPDVLVHFVFLSAPREVLEKRVGERKGHFMGVKMIQSQMKTLEEPDDDESDMITVDVSGSAEEVEETALERVKEVIDKYRNGPHEKDDLRGNGNGNGNGHGEQNERSQMNGQAKC
jgi:gluconokinase